MEENKIKIVTSTVKFNKSYEPPRYVYNKGKGYVTWGEKNLYPKYLLSIYNDKGGALHKAIIDKKVKLTTGQGIDEEILDESTKQFIKKNKIADKLKRSNFDNEIFNGFAFEVIWALNGETIAKINHIPISCLRQSIISEKNSTPGWWYSVDFENKKIDPIFIPDFDENNRVGRQIYYVAEYNPSMIQVKYPIPYYSSALNDIELSFEISKFHLNNAKQGYAPSLHIHFANGEPEQEEADEFAQEFEENFASTNNSGKAFITYSDGQDQAVTVNKIDLNSSDQRFRDLRIQIEESIITAHQVPVQLIIQTPGKLGQSEQRKELLDEFQKTYISPRQNQLEDVINYLLSFNNMGNVKLKKYEI